MASILTESEKNSLSNQFFDLHDTFSKPIVAFKNAEELVMSTNIENNMFFPNAGTSDIAQNIIVSGIFNARVKYISKEDLRFFNGGADQNTLKIEEGMVRIKVDETGSNFIKDSTRIKFDGTLFESVTSPRPHGLFGPSKFYTYYLKRID